MNRVSLDTQIIIAILTNNRSGHRSDDEWQAIRELTIQIDGGFTTLVLPTIIFTELLVSYDSNAARKIDKLVQRKSVELVDLTMGIAKRAGELRDVGRLGSGKRLKAPDAVFIATAELTNCSCLYSSDSDIYRAIGARVPLLKPVVVQLSLLPSDNSPIWGDL